MFVFEVSVCRFGSGWNCQSCWVLSYRNSFPISFLYNFRCLNLLRQAIILTWIVGDSNFSILISLNFYDFFDFSGIFYQRNCVRFANAMNNTTIINTFYSDYSNIAKSRTQHCQIIATIASRAMLFLLLLILVISIPLLISILS